jgi:hypothetical protein
MALELVADTAWWLIALRDADSGVDADGKAITATSPSRAGAAAIGVHLEIRNCACFVR